MGGGREQLWSLGLKTDPLNHERFDVEFPKPISATMQREAHPTFCRRHVDASAHVPTGLDAPLEWGSDVELASALPTNLDDSMLADVECALDCDEIVVHFQPIVSADGRRPRTAEGLVRWQHPTLGLLSPGAFIPRIEPTALIESLTRRVLERSIAACASWQVRERGLSVAVNLSSRNLLDPNLPADVERLLWRYELPAELLRFEINERTVLHDADRALATAVSLTELGVLLSLDDFGVGCSSLSNLRRLPIDQLKIDRSFVSRMARDESDAIIVRSTIDLGHDLGLSVVAEGVEDEATLRQLDHLGCDLVQGYYLGRPTPAGAFRAWLEGRCMATARG